MFDISIRDFHPRSSWEVKDNYLVDNTTGRLYANESNENVRFKCLLLSGLTPLLHPNASLINTVYRIVKVACMIYAEVKGDVSGSRSDRLKEMGIDFLRIFTGSFAIIALEIAALYGALSYLVPAINSQDAKKLYATIERAQYGSPALMPGFQPNPDEYSWWGLVEQSAKMAYQHIRTSKSA